MAQKKNASKPDIGTLLGLGCAAVGVIGGLLLEGGRLGDIAQYTAAIIVLGGTFGAVLISTPFATTQAAFRRLAGVFFEKAQPVETVIQTVMDYATKARKNGLVSLEQEAGRVTDPFLQKALTLAVDGTDIQEIKQMLHLHIENAEHRADAEARVFESAGGYAPTIGIIGAVLGLIQVMKNLSDIDKVGHGIAVSFVATVYGVALANIFLLPAAAKIRARAHHEAQLKEIITEATIGIVEGLNPKLIQNKLDAWIPPAAPKKKRS